jgi:hypothetical protein
VAANVDPLSSEKFENRVAARNMHNFVVSSCSSGLCTSAESVSAEVAICRSADVFVIHFYMLVP